jgi:hypothetical protein
MVNRFELRTDCSVLKYLFEKPTLNARKTKWMKFEVSMTLKSSISKEKKIKLLLHSIEGYISCML